MKSFGQEMLLWSFHRLCDPAEDFVQVRSFEQTIAIHWIPVHLQVASGCPVPNRVVVYAEVLSRL